MPPSQSPSIAHLLPSTAKQSTPSSATLTTSRLLTPTTNPIPLLSNPTARTYSQIHTALVLAYYYLRSTSLVADPLTTLTGDLLPLALVQAAFCAVCLPIAGTWNNGTEGGKILQGTASATPGKGKSAGAVGLGSLRKRGVGGGGGAVKIAGPVAGDKDGAGGSWASCVMPAILSLILTLSLPPLPLTALALCMGAPLYPTSLLPHTLVLALHVSLLAFLPIFYTHGVSASAWRDVSAAWLPFDEAGVWAGTVGCLVGGWVGAVPIALDWDREWQKWPCTVIWGVAMGWALGRLITGTNGLRWGVGGRINLSEAVQLPRDVVEDAGEGKKKA